MENERKETESESLDYRIYVNENFAKFDFDKWLFEQLNLDKKLSVLDLGCGTGKHLFKISEQVGSAGKVVGVDISEDSLKKVQGKIDERKDNNIELHKSDLTRVAENARMKFDRILSSFAIYYTENEEKTFNDCYNLLKDGGILFFCGPGTGNNREFLSLVEKAGGSFSKEFLKWSAFLEEVALPSLKRRFGSVESVIFENPIEFPDETTLFEYWKSTSTYNQNIEKSMKAVIKDAFRGSDVFVNRKVIFGIRCKK